MKSKYWVLILAAIVVTSLLCCIPLLKSEQASTIQITSDGHPIAILSLGQDQEMTIPSPNGGFNTVTIRNGAVAVTSASCPDHYCMDRGFCTGGTQIVCLPNRLVIAFSGPQKVDGISG